MKQSFLLNQSTLYQFHLELSDLILKNHSLLLSFLKSARAHNFSGFSIVLLFNLKQFIAVFLSVRFYYLLA